MYRKGDKPDVTYKTKKLRFLIILGKLLYYLDLNPSLIVSVMSYDFISNNMFI